MRAVADTNVYISALNFGGTAEEVLTLARARAFELFTSPSILTEVEGVLIRKFHWSARRAREAIALIREFTRVVHPETPVRAITEDVVGESNRYRSPTTGTELRGVGDRGVPGRTHRLGHVRVPVGDFDPATGPLPRPALMGRRPDPRRRFGRT